MKNKGRFELLDRGDDVLLLNSDSETTNLKKAVETTAMCLYGYFIEMRHTESAEEKEKLKNEVEFMSTILDSLSGALSAISKS